MGNQSLLTDFGTHITIGGRKLHLKQWHDELSSELVWQAEIKRFIEEWLNPKETIIVSTSGSTGEPKDIELKKEHVIKSAQTTLEFFHLNPGNRALLCLPTKYIAGKLMIVRAIVGELDLTCVAPTSQPIPSDSEFDFAAMIPFQVQKSLEKLDKIKTLIIGGAPIPFELERLLEKQTCRTFATYGMTETITHVAIRQIGGDGYFHALSGVIFWKDEKNRLVIKAPQIGVSSMATNDIVEWEDPKTFKWIGRYDNIINSGGVKLSPELIEAKLNSLITDRRFYIKSEPDILLGEHVVLVLEGKALDRTTEKLLFSTFTDELGRFEIPRAVEYREVFSETETGKLLRV